MDDHSRLLTGYRWVTAGDTLRAEAALRRGLTSHGVPGAVYLDNGSPFVPAKLAPGQGGYGIVPRGLWEQPYDRGRGGT